MEELICKEKKMCAGCTACESVCPQRCIHMTNDSAGNTFPIKDNQKCIDCGMCIRVCPSYNPPVSYAPIAGYVTRHQNETILNESNSGGFFSALASYIIEHKGTVFGVGFDSAFRVHHMPVSNDNKEDIFRLRGSKYVQSDLSGIFEEIKRRILNEELVCFSGTPCQVAGLRSYLGSDHDNLICVDLVCHGVASPKYFEKYIEYMKKKYKSEIREVRFRNKTYGYHSGTMKISFANNKTYYASGRVDYMLKAYYIGAVYRESCYDCQFKGLKRYGDFTLFDSWHIDKLVNGIVDDDKGYTNVYANTHKAVNIVNKLKESIDVYAADVTEMKNADGRMIDRSFPMADCRTALLNDMNSNFKYACKKNLNISIKDYTIESSKHFLFRTKLFKHFSYKRR